MVDQLPKAHLNSEIQFVSGHILIILIPLKYQILTGLQNPYVPPPSRLVQNRTSHFVCIWHTKCPKRSPKLRMRQGQTHLFGLYPTFKRPLHKLEHWRKSNKSITLIFKQLREPDLNEWPHLVSPLRLSKNLIISLSVFVVLIFLNLQNLQAQLKP